ncbi:MAG: hypothetical protein ACREAC_20580, partial [Blastocatellia bacterium]
LHLMNRFSIAPQWLDRYAPGVTHNEERCFALKFKVAEAVLDAREHVAYQWTSFQTAVSVVYWESTRRALAATEALFQSG